MIATLLRQLVLPTFLAFVTGALPAHAQAADSSPWFADARSGMRLIAGGVTRAAIAPMRAGVELKLATGWKTYWRYPGDSGVPPRFDFTGSQNVKTVNVAFPAPHRFNDDGGVTIGYKDGVVFPLSIEPQDPRKPVLLRVKLDYAVCEKLCVPAEGHVELTLDRNGPTFDGTLDAAEASVPKPARLGDKGPLAVRVVHRDSGGAHPRIIVDVAAPQTPIELFAEGPTPDWALPVPEPIAGAAAGLQRFAFTLDGLPPNAPAKGATLTLTLVSGPNAIEVGTPLD
jgi:DsbC/DsbD-like thiol-disulfide interchange protein